MRKGTHRKTDELSDLLYEVLNGDEPAEVKNQKQRRLRVAQEQADPITYTRLSNRTYGAKFNRKSTFAI